MSFPLNELLRWSSGRESATNAGDMGSVPGFGKSPGRKKQQPNPVFLPGKSHGQRSLAGYSPQGHKQSDMAEHTCTVPLITAFAASYEFGIFPFSFV